MSFRLAKSDVELIKERVWETENEIKKKKKTAKNKRAPTNETN
jgi:hypothetical protein